MINTTSTTPPATSVTTTPSALDAREAQLRQAAEAFEAVFLRQLIGSMRSAKLADDVFGSQATEQFRDMADTNLADNMAKQGSFGIADLLLQQFNAVLRRVDGLTGTNPAPASHGTNPTGGTA